MNCHFNPEFYIKSERYTEEIKNEIERLNKKGLKFRIICLSFEYVPWWNPKILNLKKWFIVPKEKTFKDLGTSIIKQLFKVEKYKEMFKYSNIVDYENIVSFGFSSFINTISVDTKDQELEIQKEYYKGKYETYFEYDSDFGLPYDINDLLLTSFIESSRINVNCCRSKKCDCYPIYSFNYSNCKCGNHCKPICGEILDGNIYDKTFDGQKIFCSYIIKKMFDKPKYILDYTYGLYIRPISVFFRCREDEIKKRKSGEFPKDITLDQRICSSP